MKVSQIPYKRYTIEEGRAQFELFRTAAKNAKSGDGLINAREYAMKMMKDYSTAASLANCRFTLNTADEFYKSEMDYYDSNGPLFSELFTEYADIMLSSPYRSEAEKKMNPQIFRKLDYQKSPSTRALQPKHSRRMPLLPSIRSLCPQCSLILRVRISPCPF